MIRSFADKGTQGIALELNTKSSRKALPRTLHSRAFRDLASLAMASSLSDLSLPGFALEALKGNRLGQHSIRINHRYRICFRWVTEGAEEVQIVDYH
jgi:proteic killer suppression protein